MFKLTNIIQIQLRRASSRVRRIRSNKSSIVGDYHNMNPNMPNFMTKVERYKLDAYYDVWRPWEPEFEHLNQMRVPTRKIYVKPVREWSYFMGDRVEIIKGRDKGKQGTISYIVRERNWVFVAGLNLSRVERNGQITCEEKPLLIDDEVKLVDPSDLVATDFEWRVDGKGDKLRVSTRTERIIPIPKKAFETYDYTTKKTYVEQPKDTTAKEAQRVTFIPLAKTFEMDICDQMGIKDERIPYPMYWY